MATEDVVQLKSEEGEQRPPPLQGIGPCSRRAGKRLASRLGLLGRLFASGKAPLAETLELASRYLREAAEGKAAAVEVASEWAQARRRSAAQTDSLFFHVRHNRLLSQPLAKARLATWRAATCGLICSSERKQAEVAHRRAVAGRHVFHAADAAAGASPDLVAGAISDPVAAVEGDVEIVSQTDGSEVDFLSCCEEEPGPAGPFWDANATPPTVKGADFLASPVAVGVQEEAAPIAESPAGLAAAVAAGTSPSSTSRSAPLLLGARRAWPARRRGGRRSGDSGEAHLRPSPGEGQVPRPQLHGVGQAASPPSGRTFAGQVAGILAQARAIVEADEDPADVGDDLSGLMEAAGRLGPRMFLDIAARCRLEDFAGLQRVLLGWLEWFGGMGIPESIASGLLAQLLEAASTGEDPYGLGELESEMAGSDTRSDEDGSQPGHVEEEVDFLVDFI